MALVVVTLQGCKKAKKDKSTNKMADASKKESLRRNLSPRVCFSVYIVTIL